VRVGSIDVRKTQEMKDFAAVFCQERPTTAEANTNLKLRSGAKMHYVRRFKEST
jgi:hypothetical protein